MRKTDIESARRMVIVRRDQLDANSPAFDRFDARQDVVFMAEVPEEFRRERSHKVRIACFVSAMRHFREQLQQDGLRVFYRDMDEVGDESTFVDELKQAVQKIVPEKIVCTRPGCYDVLVDLRRSAREMDIALEMVSDDHFLCSLDWFEDYRADRKSLRQEYFYREMRKMHDVLMDEGSPAGGEWNYDKQNRRRFGAEGPREVPTAPRFGRDDTTGQVVKEVQDRFSDHPGELDEFDWPVTRDGALEALDDFLENRLVKFGSYQDAMWTGKPFLYHSRLSSALNMKLLSPLEVVKAAEKALEEDDAPINCVEGFIRQVMGWREYVRCIYWSFMPDYRERNELDAELDLPWFYWTGETDMHCLAQCINQTLEYGYAHHIQRLMVTGLFALLIGVRPQEVHRWYLAIYLDALEWVELPNTLGMSQFGDGGLMASKPYAASGKYIDRMSNYCSECRYDPGTRTGEGACPFTTLYWDFLMRHRGRLSSNHRMGLQLGNLKRLDREEKDGIVTEADDIKTHLS